MGQLIETYGYYGTGETLLVGDPNEGWVMEMAGYDKNGTSGVWVARRVPDDSFFVAANQFRIRDIRPDANDMLLLQKHLLYRSRKRLVAAGAGLLDFTSVYGDGEFHHPYYSLATRLARPDAGGSIVRAFSLGGRPIHRAYAFAVKPDKKLSPRDVFAIHRDNYEGTEFDLTKGLAAGPFGDPNRFEGNAESVAIKEAA